MVKAMGLRVKSGVVIPSGSSSMYCVIITPGTLDLLLMPERIHIEGTMSENQGDTKTQQVHSDITYAEKSSA